MITGSNRKWMIYDSVYTYGDDEEMWVRGITSVHSIELFMQTSEKMLLIVSHYSLFWSEPSDILWSSGHWDRWILSAMKLKTSAMEKIFPNDCLCQKQRWIIRIVGEFNEMFERLEFSFEKERQFTSDVSHELRTPVAVIISQCEYLLENEKLICGR